MTVSPAATSAWHAQSGSQAGSVPVGDAAQCSRWARPRQAAMAASRKKTMPRAKTATAFNALAEFVLNLPSCQLELLFHELLEIAEDAAQQ